MKWIVVLLGAAIFLLSGCDSEEAGVDATNTPSPSPAPTGPTPIPTLSPLPSPSVTRKPEPPAGFDAFREYAEAIDNAVESSDSGFFINSRVEVEITCVGDEQLGPCAGQPAGAIVRGIPGSAWRSDAFFIFTTEMYRENLDNYFEAQIETASDEYGSGSLRLFALASRDDGDDVTYFAITSAIVDIYPSTGYPIGSENPEAHALWFEETKDGWGFAGETAAGTSATGNDWLSGNCGQCYDYFELWEG